MKASQRQLRTITARRYYRTPSHPRSARDSVVVTLSCKHEKHYKGSAEPRSNYAFCDDCPPKTPKETTT